MQPAEITLRYIVAAASLAVAVAALRFYGAIAALPATLTAVLVLPGLDTLLQRLFPERTGQEQPTPGQGVLRTAFSLVITTLRVTLCFAGILCSLYLIEHSPRRAALRLCHAPRLEYRPQVTLEGDATGAAGSTALGGRAGQPPRLQLNGQAVPLLAGHFASRQPLQMGLNTFRMVLDVLDGSSDKPRTLEETVVVRRVSEEQYDQETFGHSDCTLGEASAHHSGAWGPGFPDSRFSGSAELHAGVLRGRCVQELTASRLPLKAQAATVELNVSVGRGRVKVLVRHPDGQFERLVVTPEQPLHYNGSVALSPVTNTVTHPGDPSEGTPPTTSVEEFWVAYVSVESLVAEDAPDAGSGAAGAVGAGPPQSPASQSVLDADAAHDLVFTARYALK